MKVKFVTFGLIVNVTSRFVDGIVCYVSRYCTVSVAPEVTSQSDVRNFIHCLGHFLFPHCISVTELSVNFFVRCRVWLFKYSMTMH